MTPGNMFQIGVQAHADTVELFERASREAQDAEVKAFDTQLLPRLRDPLQAARRLKATVEAAGAR